MTKTSSDTALDKKLNQEIDQLNEELTPSRDLWAGIEKAIAQKPQQQTTNDNVKFLANAKGAPLAWAASIMVAVIITWGSVTGDEQGVSLDTVALMQQTFDQQKQTMLVSFGQPKLEELPQDMQEQLSQLASARKSIESALADDPNNMELINLLRWTQLQELKLIEQLYAPKWQTI